MTSAKLSSIDISKAVVMAGLLLGAMVPFLFSALAMQAVGKAAMAMIEEVRRQFNTIPQLKAALGVMKKNDGIEHSEWSKEDMGIFEAAEGKAEYGKCVEISTKSAIKQMVLPGLVGSCYSNTGRLYRRQRNAWRSNCRSYSFRSAYGNIPGKRWRCMG